MTTLAHKIALDPTEEQAAYFRRAAGTARFVYNWALEEWRRRYRVGEKPNGRVLKKAWNAIKYEKFPWLRKVHRDAHAQPFANLQQAYVNWWEGRAEAPDFHKRGQHDSFYVANDTFRVDGKRVRLPRIGWVRMREALRFTGKIMGAVVSREADRWSIAIQVQADERRERTDDSIVGVDLGITHAAVLSDGTVLDAPRPLRAELRKLRRASRKLSRRVKGSANRGKAKAALARIHARIAAVRHDWIHKLTTLLCRENQAVVIEDLNVAGMMANRCLAWAVSDMAFGEFRRQLEYKGPLHGTRIIVVDRWFPSSKTCSACGWVWSDMTLKDRTFRCQQCGLVMDRDLNAAINLRTLGLRETGPLEPNGCGEDGSGVTAPALRETSLVEAATTRVALV